jgi:hypothetical protein
MTTHTQVAHERRVGPPYDDCPDRNLGWGMLAGAALALIIIFVGSMPIFHAKT